MKYNILGGVALASVCGENMLVATQKATEKVCVPTLDGVY